MSDKRITELELLTELSGDYYLVVDDGIKSRKYNVTPFVQSLNKLANVETGAQVNRSWFGVSTDLPNEVYDEIFDGYKFNVTTTDSSFNSFRNGDRFAILFENGVPSDRNAYISVDGTGYKLFEQLPDASMPNDKLSPYLVHPGTIATFIYSNGVFVRENGTAYYHATSGSDGLMSAADKRKLDGIIIDAVLDNTSTNPVQNSVITNEIDSIASRVSTTEQTVTDLNLSLNQYVNNGYVEDGVAYFMHDDEQLFQITGIGGGGGGGGGDGGNNAILTVTNTTGWISKTVSYGTACNISFNWTSLEDEEPTGFGNVTITVNGSAKSIRTIQQGDVTLNITNYISTGNNTVRIKVTDVYSNSKVLNFNVTMVALTITSSFTVETPFSGSISFPYVPTGNVEKTVHFIVDGIQIGTQVTSVSGRQQTYTIPALTHGSHTLLVYFDAVIAEQTVLSNELYYDLMCLETGNTTPVIASNYNQDVVSQYSNIAIPYYVYDPSNLNADILLQVNGNTVSTLTVDRTEQVWTYRPIEIGDITLSIVCGEVSKTFEIEVTESDVTAKAETEDLALYLTSQGRSNSENDPSVWNYGDIHATLSNFTFSSDGWVLDDDRNTVLRITGDDVVTIPYYIFGQDFRTTGKTIEVEFATRDVGNYDTIMFSCFSGNIGIQLTPQKMMIKSAQSEISVQYKENEHVRVAFVVEKRNENRLVYCYLNGIMSGVIQYPADDNFEQANPVGITIGSAYCTTDIYCIRVYDNNLTRYQILDNWIADTQNVDTMLARFRHNNVFDEYGSIVISKLPSDLPYMILKGSALPQYKGDKKTMEGSYVDPIDPTKSFTFTGAQVDVQGTSSQYYARKNYKIKFKNGFIIDGAQGSTYAMNADAIPVNTFTFKADVASSEGANNVELVRLYDSVCPYKTPAQEQNPKVRQGIDGFPIVMFWDNGTDVSFLGKYNFNNDKGTPEVFGFQNGDESWEILNNTSNRVLWKSDYYAGNDWRSDFESRYPEDYFNITNLSGFASWIVKTDTTAATNSALPSAVTYDGVTYTNDTAEYRLAKFKAEIGNYVEMDSAIFYYLFTELFLMVDSRAKNMFPSFMGSEVNG